MLKFKATTIDGDIVYGVGYCPTNIETDPVTLSTDLGYLFTDDSMEWIDGREFSFDNNFFIVFANTVELINN